MKFKVGDLVWFLIDGRKRPCPGLVGIVREISDHPRPLKGSHFYKVHWLDTEPFGNWIIESSLMKAKHV